MTAYCPSSNRTVGFTKDQISETSVYNGHPMAVLVNCRRCHRTNLRARVCITQVGLGDDDGIATMPPHYPRGDQ